MTLWDMDTPRQRPTSPRTQSIWRELLALPEDGDINEILEQTTENVCWKCGRQYLRKFEVLNGNRCEPCRIRLVAEWDSAPGAVVVCPMPEGQWCSGYYHGNDRGIFGKCARESNWKRSEPEGADQA